MAFLRVDTVHLFELLRVALLDLMRSMSDDEWNRATVCPGWSARDMSNVLVEGLTPTIIDYELMSAGDTAFDLEWLLQYCSWPKRLVSVAEELLVDARDFEDVPRWLAGSYPELFLQPNLRERMKLYFAWDLLEQQVTAPPGDTWAVDALRDVFANGTPIQLLESGTSVARAAQRAL